MIKKSGHIFAVITGFVFLLSILSFSIPYNKTKPQQENQPPVVKLISPKNNGLFAWNTPINYEISVADKEDGDSKYDEINTKEVLLEVRYAANKAKMRAILNKAIQGDPPGLAVLRTSNCFNCHNFNSKSIGPSFYEISKRYPATKSNIDSLVKRISQGSSGIWGKEKMPTHPELTAEEIKNAVEWVLKNSTDPDVSYYIGLQGSFRIEQSPGHNNKKAAYILTASYTDHGLKNVPDKRLKGQDMVVIYAK
jgi:cytochrome c